MVNEPVLDMSVVEEAKAMMKNKFPTMIEYFLEDSATYIAAIRDGIVTKNAEQIVSPAHTLKSSSRQMGAMVMSALAKQVEEQARQIKDTGGDINVFTPLVVSLDRAFGETKQAFESV